MDLTANDCKNGFFPTTKYNIPGNPILIEMFKVKIDINKLVGFVDSTHANDI